MKAISLWQPWASAIIAGVKSYETRGWKTAHRGPILIHAAKHWSPALAAFLNEAQDRGALPDGDYPRGALLGAVKIESCEAVEVVRLRIGPIERLLGDYRDGRQAWQLSAPVQLARPIYYCGAQRIFNVPDEILPEDFRDAIEH
jgi:hypothetical protein